MNLNKKYEGCNIMDNKDKDGIMLIYNEKGDTIYANKKIII